MTQESNPIRSLREVNETDFVVDIKQSLIANIPIYFTVLMLWIFLEFSNNWILSMTDQNTKVIGIIVMMYCITKFIGFIGEPVIRYKMREEKP